MKLECVICKKEITQEDRILAFGEFKPDQYQWDNLDVNDGFDEVIPEEDQWFLSHYYCIFKRS